MTWDTKKCLPKQFPNRDRGTPRSWDSLQVAARFASLFFNFAGVFVASYRLIGKSTREEVLFLSGTVFQVLRCENLWICFIMKGIVGGILTFKKNKKKISLKMTCGLPKRQSHNLCLFKKCNFFLFFELSVCFKCNTVFPTKKV